jgi:adenylosuccinate synthase
MIDKVVAVCKAYTTRVGSGPFVTENDAIGDMLHNMGREFGATTGRARRCGWLDAVLLRYAVMVNGADELAITNLDGLDGLDEVQICTSYTLRGKRSPTRRAPSRTSKPACPCMKVTLAGNRSQPDQKLRRPSAAREELPQSRGRAHRCPHQPPRRRTGS